jgi:hypothetical protein
MGAGPFNSNTVSGRQEAKHFGHLETHLVMLDLSKGFPTKNDRAAKLGNQLQTMGAAVMDYDVARRRITLADGITKIKGKATRRTIFPFEPDNIQLRFHQHGGLKRDSVYAFRLIADHTNPATSRANRSTMLIDQCDHQRQGSFQDLFWGCDLGTDVGDDENTIGPAGYPAVLDPSLSGAMEGVRLAAAFNLAKNAGFVSDGRNVGQFWHAFVLAKAGEVGQTTTDSPCQPKTKKTFALRGDVAFMVKKDLCHLAFDSAANSDPYCGQPHVGKMFVRDEKSPGGPSTFMGSDPKSNHSPFDPETNKSIFVVVKVPPPQTSGSGAAAASAAFPVPTGETSGNIPQPPATVQTIQGATAMGFKTADFQDLAMEIPIQKPLRPGSVMDIHLPAVATASYGAGQKSNLALMYKALKRGEDPSLIPFSEIRFKLDDTLTNLRNDNWNDLVFTIPKEDLAGKDGGQVVGHLMMLSTSTGPDVAFAAPSAVTRSSPEECSTKDCTQVIIALSLDPIYSSDPMCEAFPYDFQWATATGGQGPYTFTIQSGALPDGLALTSDGFVVGTPTGASAGGAGVIRATDANGCFSERNFSWTSAVCGGGTGCDEFQDCIRLSGT